MMFAVAWVDSPWALRLWALIPLLSLKPVHFQIPVIHGDVADTRCVRALHAMKPQGFVQVTGGFPCQPYSRQGDMRGLQDGRGQVLPAIMRSAWLLQANAVLLECVDNVMRFEDIQTLLDEYATQANFHIEKLVFDLQAQWPVRRRRFWCLMHQNPLPALQLRPWSQCNQCRTLGSVMPFDAQWTDDHEQDLMWTHQEKSIYFDANFGNDLRVLQPDHQAPTMLHSWANVFTACPCGCRSWPLSNHRLQQGGARGFGLVSSKTLQVRHLHPEEGALLCTVPLQYRFPEPPRAALCLLGQIAAPLQVLWIQAQFLTHLHEHHWIDTCIDPIQAVMDFKYGLIHQCAQRWILISMDLPRTLGVTFEGTTSTIRVHTPVTAGDVERAETTLIGDGYYVILTLHSCRLPSWCQLHEGVPYQLQVIKKRQAKPTSSIRQAMCRPAERHCPLVPDHAPPVGLGDTHVWAGIKMLMDFLNSSHTGKPFTLYPFRAKQLLKHEPHAAVQQNWRHRFLSSNHDIMVIFEYANHWMLLVGHSGPRLRWELHDSLPLDSSIDKLHVAHCVAKRLSSCIGMDFEACRLVTSPRQLHSHTCGSMALWNMAHQLGLQALLPHHDELVLHHFFLDQPCSAAQYTAKGPKTADDTLSQLLASKGVPHDQADQRAQQVRDRLGAGQVQQIMQGHNPWAALKAAASKPGRMFRLVTEAELKAYVDKRAQTKHGAQIPNAKGKKQASQMKEGPLHLDPAQFQLDSQHFQDAEGKPVPQILFQDVAADQRGVALCHLAMAKPFLENPKSISLQGLALLIIDTPSQKVIHETGLKPMVFPALCTTMDEHTIIMGYILQLGDSAVTRKMASRESAPDRIDTQVIKFQAFRDQLEHDWHDFTQAPVRNIIRMIEAMQLCRGQQCGIDCAKYHPGLDEALDAVVLEVWSRAFLNDQGKRIAPMDSVLFTVFVRIPEAALNKILLTAPVGLYVEPRGNQPREHDDKYRVVWLPGASYQEALHQCKTYSKSICLVSLKTKYGIRVRKSDEVAAWGKLRPGVEFVDMTIHHIYELFPLPHGTQRQAIGQILQDWSWPARVLQPGRGNVHHMAWRVGSATPPPAPILTAFDSDVIITAVKDLQIQENKPQLYATAKTQKLLRDQPKASAATKATASSDPWLDNDPWGGYNKKIPVAPSVARSHREELQDMITDEIQIALKEAKQDVSMEEAGNGYTTETELRMVALESGLNELKQQNGQFMQWFQQTGDRLQQNEQVMQEMQSNAQNNAGVLQTVSSAVANAEKAIGEVHQTLNVHQQELSSIGTNFKTAMRTMKEEITDEMMQSFDQQFSKLEALLEKRHKSN